MALFPARGLQVSRETWMCVNVELKTAAVCMRGDELVGQCPVLRRLTVSHCAVVERTGNPEGGQR